VKHTVAILILSASIITGCADAMYRKWADKQVDAIVRDREQRTLGYEPQVEAKSEVAAKPSQSAYDKIPDSPLPPPTTSPVEPAEASLPYGKLGPEQLFPSGVGAPQADYGIDSEKLRASQRLTLGPPTPGAPLLRLDLFGSLSYAVVNARDYKARMEDLYLAALDVTLQRHLFEPRPFATTGVRYAGGQENADYAAALSAVNTLGVRQQLPYGGEVAAAAAVDFVNAISGNAQNAESAAVTLSASIPLLRGAGLVNLEPLIQSERTMVYEVRQFEEFRRSFAVDVASDYFRLLAAQQVIANRSADLIAFQELTSRTYAMYEAGRLNFIEVQRVLQDQLRAQNDLISAQAAYDSALDDFKVSLGMPINQPLEVVAQELTVEIPRFPEAEVAALALKFRLDLVTAADLVEDAQRSVQVAKNGLLPDLDFNAVGTFRNNDDDPARKINNDATTYSASLNLEIPLDRVAERNSYRRSLIQLERSQRAYDLLRDRVAAEARAALRQTRSAEISLELQAKGIELAKLRLENAYELLRLGQGGSRDVVEAQNDLVNAQEAFERAKAELQIQVMNFLRLTGTLRVDPGSGAIGASLDRKAAVLNEPLRPG
jgi:outer membrane protein TolC